MEMAVELRAMRAEDLAAILAIAASSPEAPRWGKAEYGAYLDPEPKPPLLRVAVVAEAGGRVTGLAAATLLLDGQENRCELDTIAVDPADRRRGIGAALLEAVMAWAAQNGARRMGLEVRASNAPAAMLYRRMGFAEEGRRRGYYTGPEEDALVLGRVITPVSQGGPISTEKEVEGGASRC
jgi:[ribosomal protein S18]-alanine N-acetyltransferase